MPVYQTPGVYTSEKLIWKLWHSDIEPAAPVNEYANTTNSVAMGYDDGTTSFYSARLGLQDNVVNRSTSNANSTIMAGNGNDLIFTGAGKDRLYGEDGHDYLSAGDGDDFLFGGAGNDTLLGGNGSDDLWGGAGNDTLIGGFGSDDMWGGAGADTFVTDFGGRRGAAMIDTVHDFSSADDALDLYIAGTAANYREGTMMTGSGMAAARDYANSLMTDGVEYVFVTDGTDGYLFGVPWDGPRPMGEPGTVILEGLGRVNEFDWSDIV